MDSLEAARTFLKQACNADGSLGHLPGQAGHLEPTLLGLACGGLSVPGALAWLTQQPWGWGALLLPAVLADQADAAAVDLVDRTLETLLVLEGERVEDAQGWLGFDATLSAWPWVAGTAPWVEPTAYALISLKRAGFADHARVAWGEALLRDRQCADGGWNYGNPAVLGAALESDLSPTGWATMALPQGEGEAVARALLRLEAAAVQRSTSTLSLALLAHRAHQKPPPAGLLPLLLARQRADGSFAGRCDWTALAACALAVERGEPHPFAVPA